MTPTDTANGPTSPVREEAGEPTISRRIDFGSTVQRFALPAIWILMIIGFGIIEPSSFLKGTTFASIFSTQSVVLVLTLGLILPLTCDEYDLSIASNLGFCTTLIAALNVNSGIPIVWACIIGVAAGTVVGFFNGLLVIALEVSSFIATLGVGTVLGGLALAVSNQQTIAGVSPKLIELANDRLFGLSYPFYFAMVVVAVLWWFLDFTPTGRRLLFIGNGAEVARLSGIPVNRLRWMALTMAGFAAGLAAVLNVGIIGAADPTSASTELLPAYAAAFLGATTISPGRFNALGTAITVFFLYTGFTGLQLAGVPAWVQQVFYGGALVIAVAFAQSSPLSRGVRELFTRRPTLPGGDADVALPTDAGKGLAQ
jgi:ribose transport system permease protein